MSTKISNEKLGAIAIGIVATLIIVYSLFHTLNLLSFSDEKVNFFKYQSYTECVNKQYSMGKKNQTSLAEGELSTLRDYCHSYFYKQPIKK